MPCQNPERVAEEQALIRRIERRRFDSHQNFIGLRLRDRDIYERQFELTAGTYQRAQLELGLCHV
jgi:hypothetical protein